MLLWLLLLGFCAALVPLIALLCLCIYICAYRTCSRSHASPSLGRSAAVVVLGDIGRSPRMCFHVESLANDGWKVAIVGYPGSALPAPLQRSSVKQHHLRTPPAWISRLPRKAFVAVAPFKLALQAVSLFWELTTQVHPPPEVVLVQTPPALPTLLVVKAAAALVKARVVIDWHNLAYTILALRLGAKSRLVRLAERLERWSGRDAYAHLFVTEAMKNHLTLNWGLRGEKRVLHDRPPGCFRRATVGETHELLGRLLPEIQPGMGDDWLPEHTLPETTPFTQRTADGVSWREDRPALVVSSTSWTADEDFGLLLRAARLYELRARTLAEGGHSRSSTGDNLSPNSPLESDPIRTSKERRRPSFGTLRAPTLPHTPATSLPKLLIVVTGKGELKAQYLREIATLERTEAWRFVRIRTAWLEIADYPLLLGSADLGVSLHTSSSGLDLPMKVVDMLGCGLPVCALDFACLDELVRDGYNGGVFRDEGGLMRLWESLLATHPADNWLVRGGGLERPFDAPEASQGGGTPMSPNPSMTLLHSPGLHPTQRKGRATWAGNWKSVMRPILDPRSPTDGQDELAVDTHLSRSSALTLNTSFGGILQRRAKGYTRTANDDGSGEHEEQDKQGNKGKSGFGFVSQPALRAGGETRDGLRQRKSVSKATESSLIDLDDDEGKEDPIPAIQVSRPAPT